MTGFAIGGGVGLALGAAGATVWMLLRRGRDAAAHAATLARVEHLADELARAETARTEADAAREAANDAKARLESTLEARDAQLAEQKALIEAVEKRMKETFAATGAEALRANNEQFLALAKKSFEGLMSAAKSDAEKQRVAIDATVKPINELLKQQNEAVKALESKRIEAYAKLDEQITQIAASHTQLNRQTHRLVSALRRPNQRGRWGELQLRNAVEMAGMTNHCDFFEQPPTDDADTRDRPDMIVRLPGGGSIVVDSKVAMDAYLDALEAEDDREPMLEQHARAVEGHVRRLAAKSYWRQFDRTPKLVVMFVHLESALTAALERKPDLHARAMENHVLIATPTLFVALLRAVAYGWREEDVAANARLISEVGRELYDRIRGFAEHFSKVGDGLHRASTGYNAAVGSLERRVLPSARKLKDLHATTDDEIEPPRLVETEIRPIVVDELLFPRPEPAAAPVGTHEKDDDDDEESPA